MFFEKNKLLRSFIFVIIVVVLFLFFHTIHFYNEMKVSLEENAKREAYLLSEYTLSMRKVFQKAFLHSGIELNDKTIELLPAHALAKISDEFTSINKHKYELRNATDRPRNKSNMADEYELDAINYFKQNREKSDYFQSYTSENKDYYQFAMPIYVKSYCLQCHGTKEDTLSVIKEKYNDFAFGYELNELRGIISIKIPQDSIIDRINSYVKRNLILMFFIISVILILLSFLMRKTKTFIDKNEKLAHTYAMTDSLTGLNNRRYFDWVTKEIGSDNYYLILFDLDYFKKVNDSYGHVCGDYILKEFSRILKSFTRSDDILCRYGGEEFVLLIKNIEDEVVHSKLEKIRRVVEENNFVFEDCLLKITTSVGYTNYNHKLDFVTNLENADNALYKAKSLGRNRIEKFS